MPALQLSLHLWAEDPPPFTHSVSNNKVSHSAPPFPHTERVASELDQMSDSFLIFCYPYSVVKSWNYAYFLRMICSLYEKWFWSVWNLQFKNTRQLMFPFLLLFQKITTAKPFKLSKIPSQFKFLNVLASCRKSLVCIV